MPGGGGAERKLFRQEKQASGDTFGVQKAQHSVPMKATPVTKSDPGLGATTLSHPYKAGKPKI